MGCYLAFIYSFVLKKSIATPLISYTYTKQCLLNKTGSLSFGRRLLTASTLISYMRSGQEARALSQRQLFLWKGRHDIFTRRVSSFNNK